MCVTSNWSKREVAQATQACEQETYNNHFWNEKPWYVGCEIRWNSINRLKRRNILRYVLSGVKRLLFVWFAELQTTRRHYLSIKYQTDQQKAFVKQELGWKLNIQRLSTVLQFYILKKYCRDWAKQWFHSHLIYQASLKQMSSPIHKDLCLWNNTSP